MGATLMFIGAALQAAAFGVPQMIVGRIVWLVAFCPKNISVRKSHS